MPDDYLSVAEAAQQLGISKMTVYRLVKRHQIRTVRLDRLVRIHRDDWDRYIAEHTTNPDGHPDGHR